MMLVAHWVSLFSIQCAMQVKDINARLERIEPKNRSSDGLTSTFNAVETKPVSHNPKRSSPKAKSSSREASLFGGEDALWFNSGEVMRLHVPSEVINLTQYSYSLVLMAACFVVS